MLRGAGGTLAVRIASTAAALGSALALARLLGRDGYGAYAFAIAVMAALVPVATLGLDVLALRQAAVWGPDTRLAGLLRGALGPVLFASVGLAAVAGGIAELVAPGARLTDHLEVGIPLLPLMALALLAAGALQGLQRVTAALAVSALAPRVALLVAIGAAWLAVGDDLSSRGALVLQLAAALFAAAVGAVLLARALPRPWTARDRSGARLRASIPMGLSAGIVGIAWQAPLAAAGILGDATEAGLYAAAAQASIGFLVLAEAARSPFAPLMARLWSEGDRARLQRGLTRTTRWLAAITAAGGVAAVALAEPLLSLFGSGFDEGAGAFRLLAAALVVNAVAAFNGTLLTLAGRERDAAWSAALSLAALLALLVVLVPEDGATGAALAYLGATLVRNAINTVQAWRRLGLDTTVVGLTRPNGR